MAESSKKMEPWQLILILILVVAFFGGLYLMNQAISSQLDSIETAIDIKTQSVKSSVDGLGAKVDRLSAAMAAAMEKHTAQPQTPPAEGGDASAETGEAKAGDKAAKKEE